MKRTPVHAAFLLVTGVSACLLAWQTWELHRARQINATVAGIDTAVAKGIGPDHLNDADDARLWLQWATSLSRSGQNSEAERLLGILARDGQDPDVQIVAQYNLGNHYLRQARSNEVDANAVMPLVELAKQRYRDVLRRHPDHSSARFNLEQALKLAPEGQTMETTEAGDPIKSVDVIVPDFERGDLP